MDATEETVLDLRKITMEPDRPSYPVTLPSFSFCFPPSRVDSPVSSEHSSERTTSPLSPVLPPTFVMTQRVLAAAYTRAGKPTRPFKAYPKNPLSLTLKSAATEDIDQSSNEAYFAFRQRMLHQVSTTTCAAGKLKSPPSPISVTSAIDGEPDANYWERRRKNNEAAKRSRDARRAKEDEIAIRAAFLEQENLKLKYEVMALRNELSRLRCLLYSN